MKVKTLWEHLAISILFFCSSFIGIAQNIAQDQNDYLILKSIEDNNLALILENDNNTVINLIQTLKNIELTGDNSKIDSIKVKHGIIDSDIIIKTKYSHNISNQEKKDSISNFNSIFNIDEYDYLLAQKHQGVWSLNKLSREKLINKSKKQSLTKPIYTRDGLWAFVRSSFPTRSSTLVLRKVEGNWKTYKHIDVYFSSPKLKLTSTKSKH